MVFFETSKYFAEERSELMSSVRTVRRKVTSWSLHYCCTYYVGGYHISEKGHLGGFDLKPYILEECKAWKSKREHLFL